MKLNKESKRELALTIQNLYKTVRKMNSIAGNAKLSKDRINTQKEIVRSEVAEAVEALEANNLGELSLETVDLLITLSEMVMLLDGNEDLTLNPPKYLNHFDRTVEQLMGGIEAYVEEDNWIDALGAAEDLAFQLNSDMDFNITSVGESMLSKFTPLEVLEESHETEFTLCEALMVDGRYEDVYSEIVDYKGEEYVVFKTKYDKKKNEHFPKSKFLKSPLTFKEPQVIVYE